VTSTSSLGTASSAALPPPVPVPAQAAGRAQIQLAATRSEETARTEWQRLASRIPELQGRQPIIARWEREGQPTLFRIRAGGFADTAAARTFCEQLRAREQACLVVGS
jgi:hypothetical protein